MIIVLFFKIPLFILTIVLLVYKTKFIYPILIPLILIIREDLYSVFALQLPGVGYIFFTEMILLVSFFVILFKTHKKELSKAENSIVKSIIILYISFGVLIIVSQYNERLSFNDFIQFIRNSYAELSILTTFLYARKYGYKQILFSIYIAFLCYNTLSVFSSFSSDSTLHNAFIGFASSYILIYTVYLYLSKIISKFNVLFLFTLAAAFSTLPFLGSVRGGMISMTVTSFILILYLLVVKKKIFSILIILPILLFIGVFIYINLESSLFFTHLKNNSITDLISFSTSSTSNALNSRDMLWDILTQKFLENPIFGMGYFTQIKYWGQYSTALMAHNYFIYRLAAGGLIQMAFITYFYFKVLKEIIKSDKRTIINFIAISNIISVILINLGNVHFANFSYGPIIWSLFGVSIFILVDNNSIKGK